jgi:hypothetical protein
VVVAEFATELVWADQVRVVSVALALQIFTVVSLLIHPAGGAAAANVRRA